MTEPELSFSLNDSGTGVAQVIAIIVAALTTPPGVIFIDEINSFLHPAAAKALLRNLQTRYPHHQYIISTHSPEIISSSMSTNVLLVRRSGYESHVEKIDLGDIGTLRKVCGVLGVTMSDVFAADGIIWVEGQTEETLFPFLFGQIRGAPPKGVLVTSVVATGDFNAKRKRDRELAFDVYEKLSQASAPLVKRAVFGFDQEDLSPDDQAALSRDSKGKIYFLPRRNIESFFVHPDAIAHLLNRRLGDAATSVAIIGRWLAEHGADRAYKAAKSWDGVGYTGAAWLAQVDGARLIHDLVSHCTDSKYVYSKTTDGIELTRYILEHDRPHLDELIGYVEKLYALATPT